MTSLYFAHGSNEKSVRISNCVPSARVVGSAAIAGKRLTSNKSSVDGSGKANLADSEGEEVWGVPYEVRADEPADLDRMESEYSRQEVAAVTGQGGMVRTTASVSDHLTEDAIPYESYKAMIVDVAREHLLPKGSVEPLESLPDKPDRCH